MIEDFHKKYGVEVIHAWGMTETSPLGTVNRPLRKHFSLSQPQKYNLAIKQGRPMYGVKLKLQMIMEVCFLMTEKLWELMGQGPLDLFRIFKYI